MPQEFEDARIRLGVGDLYVSAYENEARINHCAIKFLYPESTTQTIKEFEAEMQSASDSELSDDIDGIEEALAEDESVFDVFFQRLKGSGIMLKKRLSL